MYILLNHNIKVVTKVQRLGKNILRSYSPFLFLVCARLKLHKTTVDMSDIYIHQYNCYQ